MIICHSPKLIFLAVPRTASRAITQAIETAFPDCEKRGHHTMTVPEQYRTEVYFKFSSVRNPYSRTVSHYLYRHRNHLNSVGFWTFHEYVHNLVRNRLPWWQLNNDPPAVKWLRGTGCKQLIRFEYLAQDWAALPVWQQTGFTPELKPLNRNPSGAANWRLFYTQELADKVYYHQQADFDQFGYAKNSWLIQ